MYKKFLQTLSSLFGLESNDKQSKKSWVGQSVSGLGMRASTQTRGWYGDYLEAYEGGESNVEP